MTELMEVPRFPSTDRHDPQNNIEHGVPGPKEYR